jgi:probable F420-dependent oxidoreductase
MRFSVTLPHPGHGSDDDLEALVEAARMVERTGLDACSVTDHPFPVVQEGRAGHQALDPFVLLGYIAAATERLRLHFNLIVLPYRNPFLVARMLATLDRLSRGRVIAGIGAGYMRPEFEALGADFDDRAGQLEEGVAAMTAAWTGEPVRMRTARFAADGNVMQPTPYASPRPPLWRGGNGRRAIESAARSFDGWVPFEVVAPRAVDTRTAPLSVDTLPARIRLFREEAERHGREQPLDVCLVRPGRGWLADRSRAVEELQALDAMGVTWVAPQLAGSSPSELAESVAALGELASAAAVR